MIVTPEPFELNLVDGSGRPMGEGRSDGLHWSTVTGALADMERGKPLKGIKGEQEGVRMALGFVLENMIEHAFKRWMGHSRKAEGIVVPQTELAVPTSEGPIYMTLDGIHYGDGETLVEEYKATWRSMRKLGSLSWENYETPTPRDCEIIRDGLFAEFWEWMVRIMGYCHAVGTTEARLIVLFVNGDYSWKEGHGVQIRPFRLSFSEEEIAENWTMGLRMAKRIREEAGEPWM